MNTKTKTRKERLGTNEISNIQLLYIILGLLIVGMIILYSSNIFQSLPTNSNNEQRQVSGDQFHRGTDLNRLNEIKTLEESVKNNPEDYDAVLNLAHIYNDSGFHDKAVENYKKYLSQFPNSPDVIVDMGVSYFELNKFDEAISIMESALEINPGHQIAHFNLGIVNFSKGNLAQAKDWWQKTIDINPSSDIAKKAEDLIKSH